MTSNVILVVHATATWFMVGLIWLIQVVHYPLMHMVGRQEFVPYSLSHQSTISPIVAFPMFIEVATAAYLVIQVPEFRRSKWFLGSCALLALVWAATALWQVPLHRTLLEGYNTERVRSLVMSNWLRTIAWSVRGLIVAALILSRMNSSEIEFQSVTRETSARGS